MDSGSWTKTFHGYLCIGETPISAPSVEYCKYIDQSQGKNSLDTSITGYAAVKDHAFTNLIPDPTVAVARFSNGAQDKTTTAAELRLTANRVAVSISPQTLQKLRSIGAISLSGQLFDIATMLKSRDPVTITMLFTLHVAHHVSVLRNLINSRKDQDRAASPLSRYFAHSPQWVRAEQLSDGTFSMFGFQLKHTRGFKYLLIYDPAEDHRSMPQIGEACKVSFPDAIYSTSTRNSGGKAEVVLDGNQQEEACSAMYTALLHTQGHPDPMSSVNEESRDYLQRGLTAQETKELIVFAYDEYNNDNQKYELIQKRLLTIESLLDHPDLAVPGTGNGNTNDKEVWFSAMRIGLQIPNLHSKYHVFAVRAPINKSANVGDEGLPIATCLGVDFIKPEDSETTRAFFDHLCQTTNATIVRLKVDFSVKPLRVESLAIDALNHTPSVSPPPSPRSLEAYGYLLGFTPLPEPTNLLSELPGIMRIVENKGFKYLADIFKHMDPDMRMAICNMRNTNAGLHFIPGVAGSGKPYLLEFMILYMFYGIHDTVDAINQQGSLKAKFMYVLDNNVGLEAFYNRLKQRLDNLGIETSSHFQVMRLYSVNREISSASNRGIPANGQLDKLEAEQELSALMDQFIPQTTVTRISIQTQETRDGLREAKYRHNNDGSLCSVALEYLSQKPERFGALNEFLARIQHGEQLEKEYVSILKAWIKELFVQYLLQFEGVVLSITTAAADFQFRSHFDLELVLIDEAFTMGELVTLVPIALFNPKGWVITGDVNQRGPSIFSSTLLFFSAEYISVVITPSGGIGVLSPVGLGTKVMRRHNSMVIYERQHQINFSQ
ncbi:hypothetical protein EDB82DRAFT_552138 [Fusarium venenatum]|uniref:uncharacterized protein n=1 Tax=Fusarium venenatum TaxID=56646 RepID=UPI001D87A7A2|nr:hypothetical protein EDB82DRAFT_552138 [Fusarium venenatum]